MRKLISFTFGTGVGAFVGAGLIMLFAPVTGEAFKARMKAHYEQALEAGRTAAEQRRAELEAELQKMRTN